MIQQTVPGDFVFRRRTEVNQVLNGESVDLLVISTRPDAWESLSEFRNYLETLSSHKPKTVILLSSSAVYGNSKSSFDESSELKPVTDYGIARMNAELIVREVFQLESKLLILRISNVYHKAMQSGFLHEIKQSIKFSSELRVWFKGNIWRDYVSLNAVTESIVKLIENKSDGVFNIGSGLPISVSEILDFCESLGFNLKVNYEMIHEDKVAQRVYLDMSKFSETCKLESFPRARVDFFSFLSEYLRS
jgi:nucleoside-diphosphate-sugar epimerase